VLSSLVPVTAFPGTESQPALTPDGAEVLFTWKPEGAKNPALAEEMAAAYQQVGVMQESGVRDGERAKVSYRAAAELLGGLPEERRRLAAVEQRVTFLEQKIGKVAVKVSPVAAEPAATGEPEGAPVAVARVPAVASMPASAPVVVAAAPVSVPETRPAAAPRISAEDASALETRLVGVMAKAENAESSVAKLQADLQRQGLSVHPSTVDALASMRAALAKAKRQFAAGDVNGVNESLAAAEVYAARAGKAAGR
jgi:hypothetical protein